MWSNVFKFNTSRILSRNDSEMAILILIVANCRSSKIIIICRKRAFREKKLLKHAANKC